MGLRRTTREAYLQLREVLRPLLGVHAAQADADGAGGDDDDLVAILAQPHGGLDDEGEDREERLVALLVDDGAGPCCSGPAGQPSRGSLPLPSGAGGSGL